MVIKHVEGIAGCIPQKLVKKHFREAHNLKKFLSRGGKDLTKGAPKLHKPTLSPP